MDFSKFDSMMDLDGLKQDIDKAKENKGGDYKEVPIGKYEVSLEKLELSESKKGDPMVKAWFKIVEGEYEDSMIFLNQVITKGFQIHIVNELLRSMGTKMNVDFESYTQYASLLMDIHEEVDGDKEFLLDYGENKGYKTFKIVEVYTLD